MIVTNEKKVSSKYTAQFDKLTPDNNCLLVEKSKANYAHLLLKKYAKGVGKIVYSRKEYTDGLARIWWYQDAK